jgi:hypothetical protein
MIVIELFKKGPNFVELDVRHRVHKDPQMQPILKYSNPVYFLKNFLYHSF